MSEPVLFVQSEQEFQKSLKDIRSCDEFAIDLEFDKNFYRYGFNLCLVQIFTGDTCYLIDPLSKTIQIKQLFSILEDDNIQKVCFSFDEDLRLLHSMGCLPKNLYDLSIVTRLLNYPSISLNNLLEEVLGIENGSSSQQSNWYRRPLSEKQKAYAANDVLYLLKLKQVLQQQAGKNGISKWIEQENRLLDDLDYRGIEHNEIIREKDMNGFSEYEWHIFKKLIFWREEKGKQFNKPPFQIIHKDVLEEITKDSRTLMDWQNTKNVFRKMKTEKVKNELLQLLKEANEEAKQKNLSQTEPARKQPTSEEQQQMRAQKKEINEVKRAFFVPLKTWIEENHGAEVASYLLSNRVIEEIITGTNGQLPDYKKELILKSANELNLNTEVLAPYLQS